MKTLFTQRRRRAALIAVLLLPAPVIAALSPSDMIGALRAVPRPTIGAFEVSGPGATAPATPTGLSITVRPST